MRISEFRKLSAKEQQELVAQHGTLLCERSSKNFNIFLYGVDGFYVELFFFKESGEFATMKPFDNTDELTPYLREIDVGQLLS